MNKLDSANDFIKTELKGKMNGRQILSIATKDFIYLKNAIELAKSNNDINIVRENAKKYFSGLIGNLGESLGTLYGYSLVSKEIQNSLSSLGIIINVSNAGDQIVNGKRAVGDTKIEFSYKDGKILGSISMSNKLSANYGKSKSHTIKLRTTTVNQLREDLKPAYYNLISFHTVGKDKQLDLADNKETISFRRYVASIILEENLFGSFFGDNVYYFNYGEYIITMNDLLDYQIKGYGTPYTANISRSTRSSILFKHGIKEEQADNAISSMELKIFSSIHFGNLLGLLSENQT